MASSFSGPPVISTQGTATDSNNVIVDSDDDKAISVFEVTSSGFDGSVGGSYALIGSVRNDRDVRELSVVGASHGVEGDKVEGIRIQVVSGLDGDDRRRLVVGLDC